MCNFNSTRTNNISQETNTHLYFRLLGVDKLFSYAINEWLNDIKKNQLPGLLGGVGPIHSLVQLGECNTCMNPVTGFVVLSDELYSVWAYWFECISQVKYFPALKMNVLFSSGIQGLGLAPDWAVQERRSDSPRVSARDRLLWNFYCYGRSGAHQQDGADNPGKLIFPLLLKSFCSLLMLLWSIRQIYCCLCVSFLGCSWDSLWHGVSGAWRERHKEDKTVLSLWTGSSACWPEGRCSQSLYCGQRGKNLYFHLQWH